MLFLGYIVGRGCIKPQPEKLGAVTQYPRPLVKKEVRAFLGLAGYYRKFVPNFAEVTNPLVELTRKNQPTTVRWTQECEDAFRLLKQASPRAQY